MLRCCIGTSGPAEGPVKLLQLAISFLAVGCSAVYRGAQQLSQGRPYQRSESVAVVVCDGLRNAEFSDSSREQGRCVGG